jgi:hypothetical protein
VSTWLHVPDIVVVLGCAASFIVFVCRNRISMHACIYHQQMMMHHQGFSKQLLYKKINTHSHSSTVSSCSCCYNILLCSGLHKVAGHGTIGTAPAIVVVVVSFIVFASRNRISMHACIHRQRRWCTTMTRDFPNTSSCTKINPHTAVQQLVVVVSLVLHKNKCTQKNHKAASTQLVSLLLLLLLLLLIVLFHLLFLVGRWWNISMHASMHASTTTIREADALPTGIYPTV